MAALNEILRKAGEAIQNGDQRTAGILLNQALNIDFTRERTWILVYDLLGKQSGKSAEEFKHFFAQRYYPDKAYLLDTTPIKDLPKIPARGKAKHSPQLSKLKLKKITGSLNFSINWSLVLSLLKRLGFALLVLIFIVLLSYTGLDMARGVPLKPALSDAIRQTGAYAGKLIHLDLGESAAGSVSLLPVPVIEVVPAVVIRSFGLLGISLLLATILGITLGVWTAGRRSGWSTIVLLVSIIGISVPSFFAALLLQIGVIKLTQATGHTWLPVGGFGWDKHLILPALVLAARPLAQITRVTFVTIEEIISQDYVRTAHGKGLTPRSVTIRHILKNAAVPVLTTVGLSLRFSLSSLPVVEYFFGWQGIGFTLLKSISQQDDNLTIALALCLGSLFILINLLLELIYPLIDPRIRNLTDGVLKQDRRNIAEWVKNIPSKISFWQNQEFLKRWNLKKSPPEPSPFKSFINETREVTWQKEKRPERLRTWLKATVGNLPMVLGFILVSIIVVVIAFGPQLAPHSPYTTQGLTIVDGEFLIPPFEPDDVYPWGTDVLGRDILSLVLAGAQQTFILAISIVMTRLVIGFITGALAGWFEGSWFDRSVLAISEIVSSFPALLMGMILILAIGIRLGLQTFVIALSFVGWMEIMQFVRSQVMITRPKRFIESAVATGAGTLRIVWKHILPNLIPSLVSILALEIGAVLMLLGELGFIGIFIGGGAFAQLDVFGAPYHYSDVPEWGALLSGVRTYARSYPWMAIYPVLAFFVAIAGFNLLGEGLRRLIDRVGVEVTRLFFNRYAFASVLLVGFGLVWLRGNTGEIAYFERQARTFETQNVMERINVFTDPAWSGRALGTDGMDYTAKYIAQQFEELGLQAAGETFTYFQTRPRTFGILEGVPSLKISDGGPELAYHQDFVEYTGRYLNKGKIEGPVRLVQMGNLMVTGGWSRNIPALEDLDYSKEIVMVLTERDAR